MKYIVCVHLYVMSIATVMTSVDWMLNKYRTNVYNVNSCENHLNWYSERLSMLIRFSKLSLFVLGFVFIGKQGLTSHSFLLKCWLFWPSKKRGRTENKELKRIWANRLVLKLFEWLFEFATNGALASDEKVNSANISSFECCIRKIHEIKWTPHKQTLVTFDSIHIMFWNYAHRPEHTHKTDTIQIHDEIKIGNKRWPKWCVCWSINELPAWRWQTIRLCAYSMWEWGWYSIEHIHERLNRRMFSLLILIFFFHSVNFSRNLFSSELLLFFVWFRLSRIS